MSIRNRYFLFIVNHYVKKLCVLTFIFIPVTHSTLLINIVMRHLLIPCIYCTLNNLKYIHKFLSLKNILPYNIRMYVIVSYKKIQMQQTSIGRKWQGRNLSIWWFTVHTNFLARSSVSFTIVIFRAIAVTLLIIVMVNLIISQTAQVKFWNLLMNNYQYILVSIDCPKLKFLSGIILRKAKVYGKFINFDSLYLQIDLKF